jgi:hypothetical protein
MTKFKPTARQQKFIEMAERRFEARLAQPKRKSSAFSRYFLEKCSSELGIEPPLVQKHRVRRHQRKVFMAIEKMFGSNNWLVRLFRNR